MEQELKLKKKQKEEPKLEFEAGKVFGPEAAHEEDFAVNTDSATYRAKKGQGGDRKG